MRNGYRLALAVALVPLLLAASCPQSPPDLGEFDLELIMPNATAVRAVVTGTPYDGSTPYSYPVNAVELEGGRKHFGRVKPGVYHIGGSLQTVGLLSRTEYFDIDVIVDHDGNISKPGGDSDGHSDGDGSHQDRGQTSDGRLTIIVNGGVVNVNEQTVIGDNNNTQQGNGNVGQGGQGNTTGDNTTTDNGDGDTGDDGDTDPPITPPITPPEPPAVVQPDGLVMVFEGKCDCQETWVELALQTATAPVIVRIRNDHLKAAWETGPVEETFPTGLTLQDFTPEVHLYVKNGNTGLWEDLGKIQLAPGQVEFTVPLPSDNKYWQMPYLGNFGLGGLWKRGTADYYVPANFPATGPTWFSVEK